MKRLLRRIACACSLALVAGPAMPDTASLLEHVPASAPAGVVVPDLTRLDANTASMLGAMEITTASTLFQILRVLGPLDALDTQGAAAVIALSLPTEDAPDPQLAFVLPTKDPARLASALRVEGDGGVRPFSYNNETYYFAELGDAFVVVGSDEAAASGIRETTAADCYRLRADIATPMGEADIFAFVSGDTLREFTSEGMEQALSQLAGAAPVGEDDLQAAQGALASVADQAEAAYLAMQFQALGLLTEAHFLYKEGAAPEQGADPSDALSLLRALPGHDVLVAFAGDTSHPVTRSFFDAVQSELPGVGSFLEIITDANDIAFAAYTPPGQIMMAGPLSKSLVIWSTEDAEKSRGAFESMAAELELKSEQGQPVVVAFAPSRADAGGQKAGVLSMSPPPSGVFGRSAAMKAFTSHKGDRVFVSIEEEPQVLGEALAGADSSLLDNDMIGQLVALLPDRPSAVCVLNIQPVIDQFRMMFAMGMPGLEIPPVLPPVAASINLHEQSVQASSFVPAQVLKLGFNVWSFGNRMKTPPPAADRPEPGAEQG